MNYGMGFVTLYRDRNQDHPHGKEMQKSKMAVCGGLTNSCEKKRGEKQRRKGKIYPCECRMKQGKDRVLPRKCTGHSKHPLPTTQEKTLHMDITRCSTPKSD